MVFYLSTGISFVKIYMQCQKLTDSRCIAIYAMMMRQLPTMVRGAPGTAHTLQIRTELHNMNSAQCHWSSCKMDKLCKMHTMHYAHYALCRRWLNRSLSTLTAYCRTLHTVLCADVCTALWKYVASLPAGAEPQAHTLHIVVGLNTLCTLCTLWTEHTYYAPSIACMGTCMQCILWKNRHWILHCNG